MNRKSFFFVTVFLSFSNFAFAQPKLACQNFQQLDTTDVPLEELMDVPVILGASEEAACANEAANIVTSISSEEILNSGSRDLIDVLHLLPGFTFGANTYNTVAMGMRGIQADEGGVSVFVDGIMLTENRFGTTPFGDHFPVTNIDHIEIIRGASSILNGNFAQLGVINIITKNAQQADGVQVTADYGHFERGEARKKITFNAGKVFDDLELSFSGKANESQRSDRIYTDAHSDSFDMANNSQLNSLYGNFSLKYKELQIRLLSDDYSTQARDGFADRIAAKNIYIENQFTTHAAKVDFEHSFSEHFKLDSSFNFSRQIPWERTRHYDDKKPSQVREKVVVDSYKLDTKVTWLSDGGSYLALGNSYQLDDYSHLVSDFKGQLPLFTDYSAYAEGLYKTDWVDFLAGVRFDAYSQFGTNIAPRFALTKQLNKFHYKLLYSHAFHAPTGANYQLNLEYNQDKKHDANKVRELEPELTYNYEVEVGYQFSNALEVIGNVFYTEIDKYFTYAFDEHLDDYYVNSKGMDVYGFETMVKYKTTQLGKFDFSYAFYQSAKNTSPQSFQATDSEGRVLYPNLNLGMPTHKATFNHTFNFTSDFSFNHNLVFFSDRFGYSGTELKHYDSDWFYNAYFRYQNMPIQGAEMGLGLYDVFNSRYQYVQQFNGSHPPLPAESRELMFRVSYKF